MIVARAPFRVSFCGGGSDIPSFYEKYGGYVLSSTIKKYMYLTINDCFNKNQIVLKYSKTEITENWEKIKHKYFRQALKDFKLKGVEISCMADIPAGTGLGSSSSFTVALLDLLYAYKGKFVSKYKLAKDACTFEIEELGETIGKQDQFAASFGGLNFYEFKPDGFVNVEPVIMKTESYKKLENNLMLFYIGGTHSASQILRSQAKNIIAKKEKIDAQLKMCSYAKELKKQLEANNVDAMGHLLDMDWKLKRTLALGISNQTIDEIYERAISAGALGGKLLGAGGAGFMLFYVPLVKQTSVRSALCELKEMNFEIDNSGVSILFFDKSN